MEGDKTRFFRWRIGVQHRVRSWSLCLSLGLTRVGGGLYIGYSYWSVSHKSLRQRILQVGVTPECVQRSVKHRLPWMCHAAPASLSYRKRNVQRSRSGELSRGGLSESVITTTVCRVTCERWTGDGWLLSSNKLFPVQTRRDLVTRNKAINS